MRRSLSNYPETSRRQREQAIELARGLEKKEEVLWTDGSRSDGGGMAGVVALFVNGKDQEEEGSIAIERRGFLGCGKRRESARRDYGGAGGLWRPARAGWQEPLRSGDSIWPSMRS